MDCVGMMMVVGVIVGGIRFLMMGRWFIWGGGILGMWRGLSLGEWMGRGVSVDWI